MRKVIGIVVGTLLTVGFLLLGGSFLFHDPSGPMFWVQQCVGVLLSISIWIWILPTLRANPTIPSLGIDSIPSIGAEEKSLCGKCGASNEISAKFCNQCGVAL